VVEGPRGSGKSYTDAYLRYVANATKGFDYGYFLIDETWTLGDVVGSVFSRFDWRLEAMDAEGTTARRIRQSAEMLLQRARRAGKQTLIFFDRGNTEPQADVRRWVAELCNQSERNAQLLLVLSGFEPPWLFRFEREILRPLGIGDLDEWLWRVEVTPDMKPRILDDFRDVFHLQPEFVNRAVNERCVQWLPRLMRRVRPARVYISYSHTDEDFRNRIEQALALLKGEGIIDIWSDREIRVGQDWAQEIDQQLELADIMLLLVSPAYLASEFASGEMNRALQRAEAGKVRIVPVIVRDCPWQGTPLSRYVVFPRDGKGLTRARNLDERLTELADAISQIAREIRGESGGPIRRPPKLT